MSIKQTKKEIAKLVVNCSIKYLSVIKFFDLMKKQQKHYTDFTYAGNGAFAFVLKANNKLIGQTVALKVVECDSSDIVGMESVQQEYELLQGLSSKYIVKVFNCFFLTVDDDSDNDSNDEDEEQIVESKIKKQKSEIKVFFVVEQEFCQSNGFQHFYLEICVIFSKQIHKLFIRIDFNAFIDFDMTLFEDFLLIYQLNCMLNKEGLSKIKECFEISNIFCF